MSLPYYDLAASTTLLEAQTQRERVSQAVRLGWDAVALGHQAGVRLAEPQDRCSIRPVPLDALLAAATGVREALAASAARGGRRHGDPHSVLQLSRLNIPVHDAAAAQAACSSALARGYDVVAVQPGSERAFQLACAALDCDLIALDLSRRLPYRLKPAAVKAALARGLHFEISFAPALREAGLRRQLFANALALARETRGRGLVLSSGARAAGELRGPLDVANLGTLLGLSQQQALAAITSAPAAVVQRAAARRAYRGTLSVRVRSGEELTAMKRKEEAERRQRQQQAEQGQGQAGQGPEGMAIDPPAAQQRPLKFAQMAGR